MAVLEGECTFLLAVSKHDGQKCWPLQVYLWQHVEDLHGVPQRPLRGATSPAIGGTFLGVGALALLQLGRKLLGQ